MNGSNSEESAHPQWDLSGKLIIKAQLNDDIRRIPIHNEDITYDELVLMMQRVFRGKLSTSDDIALKYKDEDGDLVTIFDSSDLAFAIQCSRILKLTLLVNKAESETSANEIKVPEKQVNLQHLHKELAGIRDRVNCILDQIGLATGTPASRSSTPAQPPAAEERPQVTIKPAAVHPKEFDPFQQHLETKKEVDKVVSAFGLTEPISTPDTSTHTSPSHRPSNVSLVHPPSMPSPSLPLSNQQPGAALPQQQQPVPPQQQMAPQQQIPQQQLPQQQPMGSQYPAIYQPQQQPQQQQQRPQGFAPSTQYGTQPYPSAGFSPQAPQQQQPQPQPQQQLQQPQPQPQPQPQQQPYAPNMPYNPAGPQAAGQYPAVSQPQYAAPGPAPGQVPQQQGFNPSYPGYPTQATTPTNPYSRGQGAYPSRPQQNFR